MATKDVLASIDLKNLLTKDFCDLPLPVPVGKTFIIAEAGVNHNGDIVLAKKLVQKAKEAGADAVKFQTFNPQSIAIESAPLAGYQSAGTKASSQREMLEALSLSPAAFAELKEFCDQVGIEFMSTPFDRKSVALLEHLVKRFKIGSGEITNLPLLETIGRTGKEVILATGMSTANEVETAVIALRRAGAGAVTLLHCTSSYPCPAEDVNLGAIGYLRSRFRLPVGYSDHTQGSEASLAAVGLGATIIEKHFTLDRNLPGPDHQASLEPAELVALVTAIRKVEKMRGTHSKQPTLSELAMREVARRSLVWAKNLEANSLITAECFDCKRPGTGLAPADATQLLGKRTTRAVKADTLVEWLDFQPVSLRKKA